MEKSLEEIFSETSSVKNKEKDTKKNYLTQSSLSNIQQKILKEEKVDKYKEIFLKLFLALLCFMFIFPQLFNKEI